MKKNEMGNGVVLMIVVLDGAFIVVEGDDG